MTDDSDAKTGAGYDPSGDIKRGDPVGMTKSDVDQPRDDASDEYGGKRQEDLTAEDLKGFVKAPEQE